MADLDSDGSIEIIASAYSIVVLTGASGQQQFRARSGHDRDEPDAGNVGRTWPGIAVADADGDGFQEIITAHSGGYVSVYTFSGHFKPGWPQHPISGELRGLSVHDLDEDGSLEIIVAGAVGSKVNTWVYEHDGTPRMGWPKLSDDNG